MAKNVMETLQTPPEAANKPKKPRKRSKDDGAKGKATSSSQPVSKTPYVFPAGSGKLEGHAAAVPKPVMHVTRKNILSDKRYKEVDVELRILNDTILKWEIAALKAGSVLLVFAMKVP
jgi:glyceraldehyde-3-phosphate dehydrogenase/erythrose-4-phosphate dehydrogenase